MKITKLTVMSLLLLCLSFKVYAQEKTEYKIRDDGKDSVKISVLGNLINAFYTGQYIKRLNGNKGCHPHGKGKIKFIYDNDSASYEGEFFEAKLTGIGYLKTKNFNYEGSLIDGLYDGKGVLNFEQSSDGEFLKVDGTFKAGKSNGNVYIRYKVKKGYEYRGEGFYRGEVIDGKRFGNGRMHYLNGDELNGNWDGDLFTGNVNIFYSNGDRYIGTWKNSVFNGNGKYVWKDGSVYEGEWLNDKKHGNGKYVWTDGSYYEGKWENDKQNGYGIRYIKFSDTYWKCNWKDAIPFDTGIVYSNLKDKSFYYSGGVGGKRVNNGTKYFFEGAGKYNIKCFSNEKDRYIDSNYVGNFIEGLMHGKGKLDLKYYTVIDNTVDTSYAFIRENYDGDWVKGKRQGLGKCESVEEGFSEFYEGEWLNNLKHGKGVSYENTGFGKTEYKGNWVSDKRDGFFEVDGQFANPDTEVDEKFTFKGNYKNDQRNGQGTEISIEGTYTGNYVDGSRNGTGKMTYKNGNIYEGQWKNGLPNGEGTMTLANKTIQKGKFVNGEYKKAYNCKSVTIGTQVWMAENLNVDKFRNGDPIPQAKTKEEWQKAGYNDQPAWCYYDNNPANGAKYGKLYNFYAVNDPRGLAPEGWHIPTYDEWNTLYHFLGSNDFYVQKMKSTYGWNDNGNGTNESGFSALPGGHRFDDGSFITFEKTDIGALSEWWDANGGGHLLWNFNNYIKVESGLYKGNGFSVRCVKD